MMPGNGCAVSFPPIDITRRGMARHAPTESVDVEKEKYNE